MKPVLIKSALCLLVAFLYVIAFPPFDVSQAAYVFALPFIVWAAFATRGKGYYWGVFLSQWLAWFCLLIWLRHIYPPGGYIGLFFLSLVVSLFNSAWFWALGGTFRKVLYGSVAFRWLGLFAYAGLWVVLEWVRSWFLTGFPWLPLAASQWMQPANLQIIAWTGSSGLSFIIIFFNFGLFFYGYKIYSKINAKGQGLPVPSGNRFVYFCSEFYFALLLVLGNLALFLYDLPKEENQEPMLQAAIVQPWVPATVKWDPDEFRNNINILEQQTRHAAALKPDVIVWPEAAVPVPILSANDQQLKRWVERLVNEADTPLLSGHLAEIETIFYNGVFLTLPEKGLHPEFNAKQRLVPFGEYIPLREWLPFISTVVPLDGDILPGAESLTLPLTVTQGNETKTWNIGSLVCYEDIFPHLGVAAAKAGADLILVVTNDAWYGEEGGAYQHAAHSVLRAVETRRPVMRCGNHGWSGWIDEYGTIREVITNEKGDIYFRGVGMLSIARDAEWKDKESFYARYGDWFVILCFIFVLSFIASLLKKSIKSK